MEENVVSTDVDVNGIVRLKRKPKLAEANEINYDYNYTNMTGINALNGLGHAIMYPARLFAENVFYGIAFMGVIGLIFAGGIYYLT